MKTTRAWKREQTSRYGGLLRLGERSDFPVLPAGAVVSITHGIGMRPLQMLVSTLMNHIFILPALKHNEYLLFAEGHGDLFSGESLLITVWRGKGMIEFRDKGGHGWAKNHLTRFVFGQNVTAWFLTYTPKDHRIPSALEARHLSETFGKMMVNGSFVRSAVRPVATNELQTLEIK
jgi:hypothetical protein